MGAQCPTHPNVRLLGTQLGMSVMCEGCQVLLSSQKLVERPLNAFNTSDLLYILISAACTPLFTEKIVFPLFGGLGSWWNKVADFFHESGDLPKSRNSPSLGPSPGRAELALFAECEDDATLGFRQRRVAWLI